MIIPAKDSWIIVRQKYYINVLNYINALTSDQNVIYTDNLYITQSELANVYEDLWDLCSQSHWSLCFIIDFQATLDGSLYIFISVIVKLN